MGVVEAVLDSAEEADGVVVPTLTTTARHTLHLHTTLPTMVASMRATIKDTADNQDIRDTLRAMVEAHTVEVVVTMEAEAEAVEAGEQENRTSSKVVAVRMRMFACRVVE